MCNIAVAPLVGAWIEIMRKTFGYWQLKSLLSWERGLKLFAGIVCESYNPSLLSWERGLKYSFNHKYDLQIVSLLSWERGLK